MSHGNVHFIETHLYRGNEPRGVLRHHILLETDDHGTPLDDPLLMFLEAVRDAGASRAYADWGDLHTLDAALEKQSVYPCETFPSGVDVIHIERQQTALLEYEAGFDDTLSIGVGRNIINVEISQSDDGKVHDVALTVEDRNLTTHRIRVHVPEGSAHAVLTVTKHPNHDGAVVYTTPLTQDAPEEV